MTLKDAKALRDYIHSKDSVNCTVPLGFGPDRYFATSILSTGPRQWQSRADFRAWLAQRLKERRRQLRDYERLVLARQRRGRSPIELMVDRACGIA